MPRDKNPSGARRGARDTRQAAGGLGAREGGARPGMPDPSRADAQAAPGEGPETLRKEMDRVLWPGATVQDVASLVGAPDDASVRVSVGYEGELFARLGSSQFEAMRSIARDRQGSLFIHNDFFRAYGRGKVVGFNGYYTWARFGYNRRLSSADLRGAPPSLARAKSVADLMATKAGRDWWKAHGREGNMRFDLATGSASRRTLAAYVAERRRAGDLGESIGLKLFVRQVRNASRAGVKRIDTFAAGNGPEARSY